MDDIHIVIHIVIIYIYISFIVVQLLNFNIIFHIIFVHKKELN